MTSSHLKGPILVGHILDSVKAFPVMRKTLLSLQGEEIWIISAYLKRNAIEKLMDGLDQTNKVKIMVRWQPNDILSGASDFESYEFAKEHGWHFYARQDLHAKAYRFGSDSIFMGSPNLTNRGFSLFSDEGNAEIIVKVEANNENINELSSLFNRAVLITDKLFYDVKSYLEGKSKVTFTSSEDSNWPITKAEMSFPPGDYSRLLVSECFMSNCSWIHKDSFPSDNISPNIAHDFSLLGVTAELPPLDCREIEFAEAIKRTKIFRWLESSLYKLQDREMYFGQASALLHDALLDDPRPYRSEVKDLLANLFAWIGTFPKCGLVIDRPNHSERVRIR